MENTNKFEIDILKTLNLLKKKFRAAQSETKEGLGIDVEIFLSDLDGYSLKREDFAESLEIVKDAASIMHIADEDEYNAYVYENNQHPPLYIVNIKPKFEENHNRLKAEYGHQTDKPVDASEKKILRRGYITSLIIVRPKNDGNHYFVVINEDYNNPLEVDKGQDCWRVLFEIAEGNQSLEADKYKSSIDLFNTNQKCKLYTRTEYNLTKIIKAENGFIVPAVKIDIITDKALKQRQNSVPKIT